MSRDSKPALRIDWFDGTLIEETSSSLFNTGQHPSTEEQQRTKPKLQIEKKTIGFKRLYDISFLKPPRLALEVASQPGFWNLFDEELKGDYIVVIVRILAAIYISLKPGEESKIVTLLRSKFETSYFKEVLGNYLMGLPSVRVAQKKMNSHLWNDVQAFYFHVVSLYEGIINFGGNSNEYLEDIFELVKISETSARYVQELHKEIFDFEFFEKTAELKIKLKILILNKVSETSQTNQIEQDIKHVPYAFQPQLDIKDVNHFRNLSIFPTKQDVTDLNSVKIKPHIINGAYPSVEQYLDLQFKLLREDCFGPLREGICKYMQNPSLKRHDNIRVYPKVRLIRTFITNNKVGHLVDIAWTERAKQGAIDSRNYINKKQLMFGSLLLFTSDNFETILCATVLDSSTNLLAEGYVAVSFQNPISSSLFSQQLLMVESEVFFEPYHRVLKRLQDSRMDDLPMRKYIVDVQKETQPPAYLTPETMFSINEGKTDVTFPVLDTETWPSAFDLDQSQTEVFKFALTREFAVVQGPPGTGKTFIGVKVASILLKNLSLEGTPMLIICYTNHALDQFLEGLLGVTSNIVRLGSQSKSKILEPYNLTSMRTKVKSSYYRFYNSQKAELEKIYKQMIELQTEMQKCEKEILTYNTLKPYLQCKLKFNNNKEDCVLTWLFSHLEDKYDNMLKDDNEETEDWEQMSEDKEDKIDTCFSEEWAEREITSMVNSIKYVNDVSDDHCERQNMADKFETVIRKLRRRLLCLKRKLNERNVINLDCNVEVEDPYKLSTDARWDVYFAAVDKIKVELMDKTNELLKQHSTCSAELEELATLVDGDVIKMARVVGVTTTMAARRHDLMRTLKSPIVIVEEAAEVLEAHIVASLTDYCQHLILIGDHKQLRPTAAHYRLARDFNLEISLFERMIRNGIHARTLSTQRRMREEFVKLLVPTIYDKLDSHPNVYKYGNVRGMKSNLFFLTHDVFDDSEGLEDGWSHKNTLEAKWCVALANYLRQMKYGAEEITILATYTGQVSLIKRLSMKHILLKNLKITVVDNYQGEENRIVILSLVRSNRDGKIGFLANANRICVALSRAKEGFYMFGNMDVLKQASDTWRKINDALIAQNAIGTKLTICCNSHPNSVMEIGHTEDFKYCLQGACLRRCKK